uniref:Uncharacterized protein n=1 Tax=Lactuca sativa TaxID=4236 RepID=A0A9R1VJD4_LACSA|nr:hypothetical protein LSAT_V11C500237120 [Lactuca sativa]
MKSFNEFYSFKNILHLGIRIGIFTLNLEFFGCYSCALVVKWFCFTTVFHNRLPPPSASHRPIQPLSSFSFTATVGDHQPPLEDHYQFGQSDSRYQSKKTEKVIT